MAKDSLARGARSAQFFATGKNGEKVTLKNVSREGRDTSLDNVVIKPVEFKKRTVRPINKQVLVERSEAEDVTTSGIVLEASKEVDRPAEGIVLAISDKVDQVQVGDRVLFGKYAGQEVKVGGTKDNLPLLMDEDEILGIVEG